MNINKFIDKVVEPFQTVDWKEFKIGMVVYLAYFTIVAIILLLSETWVFDMIILYYYIGGFIVSIIFNLINPNNHKKNGN